MNENNTPKLVKSRYYAHLNGNGNRPRPVAVALAPAPAPKQVEVEAPKPTLFAKILNRIGRFIDWTVGDRPAPAIPLENGEKWLVWFWVIVLLAGIYGAAMFAVVFVYLAAFAVICGGLLALGALFGGK